MVPVPEEYTYEYFLTGPADTSKATVTCLLPNGIVICLNTRYDVTLAELKEDVWFAAQSQPLFGVLHDMSEHVFLFINSMAQMEEVTDESKRLCDIKPTGAVLKIVKCSEEQEETQSQNKLNVQISHLIGKRLEEFDALSSAEINDFRFKMRKFGEEIICQRSQLDNEEKLLYHYPRRIVSKEAFKKYFNYTKRDIVVTIKLINLDNKISLSVSPETFPEILLEKYLEKMANRLNIRENVDNYVLKVYGQDEYLIGNYQLIEFQYIQEAISNDVIPVLLVVKKSDIATAVEDDTDNINHTENKKPSFSTLTLRKKNKYKSAWSIKDVFKITLNTISGINCDTKRNVEIGIQVSIFHGGKSLCEPQKIVERTLEDTGQFDIDKTLEFNIEVCNIPKNAKLCFVVYEVNRNSKSNKTKKLKESLNKDFYLNPIAWANTTIYDFKNLLKMDAMSLYMWNSTEDMMNLSDDIFHPLGTVVSNPDTKYATTLTIQFDNYGGEQTIIYPSLEAMVNYAKNLKEAETYEDINKPDCAKLILENDSLYEVHDQDRTTLWKSRYHWLKHQPDVLPKLLHCVDWEQKEAVSEAVAILQDWPLLQTEKALELLDYAYANQEVRSFAVMCLKDVSDEYLQLYLLQLVQAIKHELFLDCDLVKFLLKRALQNRKIGHYLFWHLRSEMQVPSVSVRFGLILEAYCRGSWSHITDLSQQLECLEKLKSSSEIVKQNRDKEKAKAALKNNLEGDPVKNFRSPLDPSFRCKNIRVQKCRVMDSKMKPLWIVFENADEFAQDVCIIFKNGDDLRQDMLTLQMLRIMDKIWKKEGLDLRMNPYNCISLEYRIGMIEVVLNAETIANIQKEKGTFTVSSAFRKGSLLAWLKDHNNTEAQLRKAITEFTLSCAGYCVATYVLGVADRHSDNIMIKKTGQLFHIDFGHILGHFKEKFGFKRERVPFVLTHDFVHVINKGQKNNLEFKMFQEYCEKAFLILRKHGSLILSLFAMMISTGLPELSSEKDLNYLKETLVSFGFYVELMNGQFR
ncbi:phosphatidylinositol kinase [Holotrichia oblita]|uniref:Phosphatidylinositol kinase n=1 Tax=Holotrichia oblita TaxID=644536 RepID=A0ACB9T2F3_HOLOL|nr:phosphatidylinositol kinase [Holotrichia oblita]